MAFQKSDLKIAIIDKASFPRDKVCGDAIGGRVKHVLNHINPEYARQLDKFPETNVSSSWSLHAPNGKSVDLHFVNPGYVTRRVDFDNFLLNLVKENTSIEVLENFKVQSINRQSNSITLNDEKNETLYTKLLIACDGAHSVASKSLSDFKVDLKHYSGAVRAYYKNIDGIKNPNEIEIHLVKNFLPGYFWIFPFDKNSANVGFGMLSDDIKRRRINLKSSFHQIITDSAGLSDRFKNAEATSELEGFGLPLGGRIRSISGDRYMLCGDAASLIDPLNGEGIGNAMWSGYFAAKQAEKCFSNEIFSESFISSYDKMVYNKLGKELKSKLFMQKAFNRNWLINSMVNLAIASPGLKNWFGKRL